MSSGARGCGNHVVKPRAASGGRRPWRPVGAGSGLVAGGLEHLADALDALAADVELTEVLGGYFVSSFLAYKRNEIERFERYVTDWEFREYAYHL